jgi:hypothetical protein
VFAGIHLAKKDKNHLENHFLTNAKSLLKAETVRELSEQDV